MAPTTRASRRRTTNTPVIGGILAALDVNNVGKATNENARMKVKAKDISDFDEDTERQKLQRPPASVIISSQILSPDASLCVSELSSNSERKIASPKFLFPRKYNGVAKPKSLIPEDISYRADEESLQKRDDFDLQSNDNDDESSVEKDRNRDSDNNDDDSDETSENEFHSDESDLNDDSEEDEMSEQDDTDFINDDDEETEDDFDFSPPCKTRGDKAEAVADKGYIPEETDAEESVDYSDVIEEESVTTNISQPKDLSCLVEAVCEILQDTHVDDDEAEAIALFEDDDETEDEASVIAKNVKVSCNVTPTCEETMTMNQSVSPGGLDNDLDNDISASMGYEVEQTVTINDALAIDYVSNENREIIENVNSLVFTTEANKVKFSDDIDEHHSCGSRDGTNKDRSLSFDDSISDDDNTVAFPTNFSKDVALSDYAETEDEIADFSRDETTTFEHIAERAPSLEQSAYSTRNEIDEASDRGSGTIDSGVTESVKDEDRMQDTDFFIETTKNLTEGDNSRNEKEHYTSSDRSFVRNPYLRTEYMHLTEETVRQDEMHTEAQEEDAGSDVCSEYTEFTCAAQPETDIESLSHMSSGMAVRCALVDLKLHSSTSSFIATGEYRSPILAIPSHVKRMPPKPEHENGSAVTLFKRASGKKAKHPREGSVRRGKWALGSKIGTGSFGVVHIGMNTQTGQLIAVKSIELAPAVMKDIRREIDVLKSLEHKNIVRYLGAERDEKNLHIFQEWVPGGSVTGLINKFGSFPIPVVRSYLAQILTGLAYLHANGILHRDIKGGNVLITDDGIVKLADFGASKRLSHQQADLMESLTMRGTPYFMAPEVFEEKYGGKADIWSVGCVAFQMATGSPPWKAQGYTNPMSLFLYLKNSEGSPPLTWTESASGDQSDKKLFEALLTKCLNRTPSQRPTAQGLMSDQFFIPIAVSEDETSCGHNLFSPGSRSCSTFTPIVNPAKTPKAAATPPWSSLMTPPLPTRIQASTFRVDTVSPLPPCYSVLAKDWPIWARESTTKRTASPVRGNVSMLDSLARSEDSSVNPFGRKVPDEGDSFKISVGSHSTLDGLAFVDGKREYKS